MELESRQTASSYINNLLLSRGLLRNGVPIEFAKPDSTEGGVNATMSQVMNLVHDLILRRDVTFPSRHSIFFRLTIFQREAETMSSLSQTAQSLRTTISQQNQSITQLQNRSSDIDRQLALVTAQERSAQATLHSAETRNRALREEMARLKASVAQLRGQCATDLRRRDGEISRLKKHLEGRRGRDGNSNQIGVVVVTPGMNKAGQPSRNGFDTDLDSPEYSLKQETTEFLTQLSQGLSDENDSLIGLVRGTLATLRSLQGLPPDTNEDLNASVGLEVQYDDTGVMVGPPSYETLATRTDEVLEHLRGLLTNPSFVPIEELELREEEIHRLREGWEMMAGRWKEAVTLLVGWEKKVARDGDTIKLEDLKLGLKLGSGMPSAEEARHSPFKLDSLQKLPIEEEPSEVFREELLDDLPPLESEEEEFEPILEGRSYQDTKALRERHTNTSKSSTKKRSSDALDDVEDQSLKDRVMHVGAIASQPLQQENPSNPKSKLPRQTRHAGHESASFGARQHANKHGAMESPTTTVAEKLEMAKKEAEAARQRANSRRKGQAIATKGANKKLKSSRRRSTLSPQELLNLMNQV